MLPRFQATAAILTPGDSSLRHSFDIGHGKAAHEPGIDAQTGKVLQNSDDPGDSD